MSDRQPTQAIRMRSIEDEARTPKYAHYERERRWLIDCAASAALDAVDPIEITDRYVAGTRMRLRQMRQGDDVVWKLTKKYECADPLERPIVTTYLTSEEFELLAGLPAIELTKQRFSVSEGSLDFSLDRFGGPLAGLELAEIETSDLAGLRALNGPPWALREVSLDPRYQGATLAANGVPTE